MCIRDRHFEVQQQQRRERIKRAVIKRRDTAEILHTFPPIANDHERVGQFRFFKSELQNEPVGFLVFSREYCPQSDTHNPFLFAPSSPLPSGSSTQKRLPAPASDSTPTLPTIRST